MATINNTSMAPDNVYLMLKADMITIKQQEQILQTEIEEIANKFRQLLESCGIDPDAGSGTMALPSTPLIMKSSGSITHVTKLGTPTFMTSEHFTLSDTVDDNCRSLFFDATDVLLESLVNNSDGLPINDLNICSKAALIGNNSNCIGSPHGETNQNNLIEALRCLEKTSPSLSRASTLTGFSQYMSSSDTYFKSDEPTDKQVVPECYDLDKEFMSRVQYYSDFTIDRQRKINLMVFHLCGSVKDLPCEVSEDILTRHVEGKESSPERPEVLNPKVLKPTVLKHVGSSSPEYQCVPTSCHRRTHKNYFQKHRCPKNVKKCSSKPLASSTMIEDSFSSSSSGRATHHVILPTPKASSTLICESEYSSGSSRRSRTNGSNARVCSSMLNKTFLSSGSSSSSKHRSSSIPQANSTMIHDDTEPPAMVPCSAGPATISVIKHSDINLNNDNDCNSVYTWSIYDEESGSDMGISLEESYIKKTTLSDKKTSHKPPLPAANRIRCESVSSRNRGDFGKLCQDHKLHKLLGEPCSETILACMSAIKSADDTCQQKNLFVESVCDKISCEIPKSNNMPRSSTRIILHDKSSGSSSMEAYRASLPDLASVHTSNNNDDQSVPRYISTDNDDDKTNTCEHPEVQGKSNSSNENNKETSWDNDNVDSVFTDSFTSVSSVNALHNSMRANYSSRSGVRYFSSSDTDRLLSNSNTHIPQITHLPRTCQLSVNSPKVQNIDKNEENHESIFKMPKQTTKIKHLFRFGRNKSKMPSVKTTTQISNEPTPGKYEMQSRRQLFSSKGTANLHREAKISDKKIVFHKFKKFSDSFIRHRDKGSHIQTLANL